MDRPTDLKRVLAEEIHAAIAGSGPAPDDLRGESDLPTADARASLRRAAEVLTPSVPSGAPLGSVKRLLIRALRFLWRNQSTFNAMSLEGSTRLATALDRAVRRSGIEEARVSLLESGGRAGATAGPVAAATPPAGLPPGVYALFEERFRGSTADVARGQRFYLDLLHGLPGPVVDVGCGRGEFLRLLGSAGIPGSGVESNPVSVEACRREGLDVVEGDALAWLAGRPPASLGAVVAFQVVEHWLPGTIFRFLQEARRALAPGGIVIAETINADSVSAMRAFYLDPTHVRPVPPDALRFLAEAAGFTDARIEYRSPLPAAERLEETSENERKLNALLFAAQDYALIARVPASP